MSQARASVLIAALPGRLRVLPRLFCLLMCLWLALPLTPTAAAPARKAVLLVFPYQADLPQSVLALQAMRAELDSDSDMTIDWYYEYLDLNRFPGEDYQQQLVELYAAKYRHAPIDLVFVISEQSLDFWLQHRGQILPNTPVVFCDILPERIAAIQLPADVTGLTSEIDHIQLLTWVVQALPEVTEIAVVQGIGKADQEFNTPLDALKDDLGGQVQLTDWSNLPLAEIKQRAAALPPSSIIFYQLLFKDAAGVKYRPIDVLRELVNVSAVPVISKYDHFIGLGTVGGYMYSLEQVAGEAARLGARILRGEAARDIPVANYQSCRFIFDHLALQRYNIPLSALPAGSIIKNRQYTFWEEYRPQLLSAGVVIAALTMLVVYLGILTNRLGAARRALSQLNANLEIQVQERTAALGQTNRRLEAEIAERLSAEQELRAREHELRMITDYIPIFIGHVDAELRYRFVNKRYVEAFDLDAEAIIGKHVRDVLGEAYYDRAAPFIEAALAGQKISFESAIDLPHQGTRWLSVNYVPEVAALGSGEGLYILAQDITERKQVEDIIRLRLRLFEFAADHSLEELMQYALDEIGQLTHSPISFYHFVEADQKTLSLQAWSTRTQQEFCKAEGKGRHYDIDQAGVWVDCVHQRKPVIHNDYAALPASRRKGMPDGHAEVKRELVVPTMRAGRIVSILGVGNKPSDYDEKDVELVAYVADVVWNIIERKQAEAQLQDYQRQLEAQNLELRKLSLAIEQSGSTIVITDTDGAIQYANPRFEETTGYTLREARGQNPRILKSGEQNADYYRVLWETITRGQIWRGEFHNRRKDGTLYWESATIAPVHNATGQITHYIAIKEDITEVKQAQEALRQYAEQLAAQNAELDAFAHTVAHDLKNPIGIIVGYAGLLLDDYETMSPQDLANALRRIFQVGKKLDTIIEELMLLAGVRKQEVTPQSLDMGHVVREAIERLQVLVQDRQAQITVLDEAAWPVALGYAPWIEEVWANYIGNAIKYGGQPPQIKIGADLPLLSSPPQAGGKERGIVRFWVQDNGPGLSEEAQRALFTPFTRLEQVRAKGHGLGLSVARRIVEKLGGQVGVESTPGQGSTFFFTLPAAPSKR